jgi:oligopeptide transport system ATP-binding protein
MLLDVKDLRVTFSKRTGLRERSVVHAVDGVSFGLVTGETLGLVGESGCGKSTTARGVLRLIEPSGGSVTVNGREWTGLHKRELKEARRDVQMVFQDPYSSLDPALTVGDSVSEPLDVHFELSRREKRDRVGDLFERVGLPAQHMYRYPHEFSGGQRQRITIARALAADPKVLILDEAVSALDVSTQNQVITLLEELSAQSQLAYLFIAHDLSVVRHIADRVAVMYLGKIVEQGPTAEVFGNPGHPYTEALLSAVPVPSPRVQRARERIVLAGDPPDPASLPSGCRFRTRCRHAMEVCETVPPPVMMLPNSVEVACHLHTDAHRGLGLSPSRPR